MSSTGNARQEELISRDEMDEEDPIVPVSLMEESARFEEIVVWGHEMVPDDSTDTYTRSINEWVPFAKRVIQPIYHDHPEFCSLLTLHRCIHIHRHRIKQSLVSKRPEGIHIRSLRFLDFIGHLFRATRRFTAVLDPNLSSP